MGYWLLIKRKPLFALILKLQLENQRNIFSLRSLGIKSQLMLLDGKLRGMASI
jgi:hypothetical protein